MRRDERPRRRTPSRTRNPEHGNNMAQVSRRAFTETCVSVIGGLGTARLLDGHQASAASAPEWLALREDPVRKKISGVPDLDTILALFPRTTGQRAFDPGLIAENIKKLNPRPAISTGHPFLDLSVKTGLAYLLCHPRESGGPQTRGMMDSRFRGNDMGSGGATRHSGGCS